VDEVNDDAVAELDDAARSSTARSSTRGRAAGHGEHGNAGHFAGPPSRQARTTTAAIATSAPSRRRRNLLPRCYPGGWVLASHRVSSRPFSAPPPVSQKHAE
jgi:hypothetical protein